MATARDIITRSLRLIGAIAAGEDASAEDAADGLDALNDMLFGWKKEGVDLQHPALTLSADLIIDRSYNDGITYNLAVRLAPEYGKTVPPYVDERARASFAAFQAHTLEFDDDLKPDRALQPQYFRRRTGTYNIDEG